MSKGAGWFGNLRFRHKIAVIWVLASLVPILVLGVFCYERLRGQLILRERESMRETLWQAADSLDYKIGQFLDSMDFIAWDQNLKKALAAEYGRGGNYEMYRAYKDTIEPLFTTIRTLNGGVKAVTLYSDNGIYPRGGILRPLSQAAPESWFGPVTRDYLPHLEALDGARQFYIRCRMYMPSSGTTNIVELELDYGRTFGFLSGLIDGPYALIVAGEDGVPVCDVRKPDGTAFPAHPPDTLRQLSAGELPAEYVAERRTLQSCGWELFLLRPIRAVNAAAASVALMVLAVLLLCILFLALASAGLSRAVVRPLEELARNMDKIEDKNLEVTVETSATDEVGRLIGSFSRMAQRLDYLIHEVYEGKIAQQKYELQALQAQINPHFFYNSLSLINSKAIMAEQEEISRMARLLSAFYRTTLNRGKSTLSVGDEWANMMSYTEIQHMMHSGSFDVSAQLEEGISGCPMLNLLLQPLVENAIVHGLDHREAPGSGRLTLDGRRVDGNLVFTVADNGCGIAPDILDALLTAETAGYGVRNVHHRVRLFYGEPFGLCYDSAPGEGTRATLVIPEVLHKAQ